MDLAALCWTTFCILPFPPFTPPLLGTALSPAVNRIALPTTLVILVMERVSPTVYLGVLCCIFGTTLVAFLTLLGANTYQISIRGKRRQTGAVLSKLVLDLVSVILAILNFAERTSLDDSKFEAYFNSRHTVIDHLINRNHSVG